MPDRPLIDTTQDTANELYFDLQLRHQIGVRRLSAGVVKEMLVTLSQADKELVSMLRSRLPELANGPRFAGTVGGIETKRYERLRDSIILMRRKLWAQVNKTNTSELLDMAEVEAGFEIQMLEKSVPVRISFATVSAEQVISSIVSKPFGGGFGSARTLEEWFSSVAQTDQAAVINSLRQGIVQGRTIESMVREIAGTRKNQFTDGILSTSRRNAETIVRTGVNHISNAARESIWTANSDVISMLRWTATLDGRTSMICMSRDGSATTLDGSKLPAGVRRLVPPGARPPAHPNCRSVMIAILSGQGISDIMGDRPFVRDTRTRSFREKDFRAEAREADRTRWNNSSPAERNQLVKIRRDKWSKENVGTLPASTDYDTWLRRQPPAFQDEVLGFKKAEKFRGGVPLSKYVDETGRELTLKQFKALGL